MTPEGQGSRLGRLYEHLVNIPDQFIGWIPPGCAAGHRQLSNWKADLIFASGPPFTTLIIGSLLARWFRIPWVAEFRDRWWDDPYYPPPWWRQRLDKRLESRVLRNVAGVVTVSEPWAETYRRRYGKPTIVVYNGYDPRDYTIEADAEAAGINGLTIAYTGAIYPGRRDPSALFEALPMMDGGNGWCRVEFYGTNPDHVFPLADKFGVRDLVYVYPRVPRKESLAIQRRSDILLFMQWNDPKEQGNVPGKLFDYLAARRPILVVQLRHLSPMTFESKQ